jgi:peptidylprolyl isomerase
MKINILIFTVLIILHTSLHAQHFSSDERKILEFQDLRTLGTNNELLDYLKTDNETIQLRTLTALANISDTNTISDLSRVLLTSIYASVRLKAVFALGQMPCRGSVVALQNALETEKTETVIESILDALGRVGDEESLNIVCGMKNKSDNINKSIAMSIARFAMRKIWSQKSLETLVEFSHSNNEIVFRDAAYGLSCIGDKDLLRPVKADIKNLTTNPDALTRMWAYTALGRTKDSTELKYILDRVNSEESWKVKVSMFNATSNFEYSDELIKDDYLIEKFYDLNHLIYPNVIISSFNAVKKLFSKLPSDHKLKIKIKKGTSWIFKEVWSENDTIIYLRDARETEGINMLAYLYKDEIKNELLKLLSESPSYDVKAAVIRSFGYFNDPMVYRELRDSISAIVQRYKPGNDYKKGAMIGSEDLAKLYKAFVETLADLDDKMDDENRNIVRLIFTEFAASRNLGIVVPCLTNLTDTIYTKYRDETSQVMLFDYNELKYPEHLEVMQMFCWTFGELKSKNAVELLKKNLDSPNYDLAQTSAEALMKITGEDFTKDIKAPKFRTDFDWDYIEKIFDTKYAVIKTNYGNIKIELLPEVAPFTVLNFVKLSKKKYFDGIVFHRVVPNFVIQTGDPTGSGYSGPGWSIRSEFSDLTYDEYVVGMASSGKDTEGSQFFITHSPQPHLDGRYTIFARVVEGMEIVDKIQVGDKIESVTITEK